MRNEIVVAACQPESSITDERGRATPDPGWATSLGPSWVVSAASESIANKSDLIDIEVDPNA
jgi:hypothetical protein